MDQEALDRILARSEPRVRAIVDALVARTMALPGVAVDPKGTCVHLNRRIAFAGLHPRRSALLLNLQDLGADSKAAASARSRRRRPIAIITRC